MPPKATLAKKFDSAFQRLEDKYERSGKWRKAQKLRRKQHKWRGYDPYIWRHVQAYIECDIKLRYEIHVEAALLANHETLYHRLNEDSSMADILVSEMQDLQKKLQEFARNIWKIERETHTILSFFPDGPIKRALCARQQQSDWHLSEWLRADCAGHGGCCGRGCGCCTRPRSEKRPNHVGHCTMECMCCEKVRGFKIDIEDLDDVEVPMLTNLDLMDDKWDSYTVHLVNAYVWGL
ncbi:hypothetical protein EYZ11_012726 [Aspergillus tanneri]|uniref:Uncharacterized protein n=1 Tax=Aspergillus tanneri TaxID=1220188 RepID=A0A4S3IZI0_9EURO|nr:hypothetical protein EYZ11_012726 [Aspergillus tanneri]